MRFHNKVAIVTGSGGGIGEHYARRLAAEGAAVIVAEINAELGEKVAASLREEGARAQFVRTDVSDEASCKACAAETVKAFGGVDYLINNAAIYGAMVRAPWMEVDLDYYRKFMEVNLNGALLMTRVVYAPMVERGGGAIVNQSSTAAWTLAGFYGLSKLGINGLTVSLAKELGPKNIRVNAVSPGPTETPATAAMVSKEKMDSWLQTLPLGRTGTTQDIANTCLFLLSDEASWVTGQIWCVDGGAMLKPA
jgi:NAD(P)-dependent dehydrogenase (short-subunit alcohol dehydrogenase family)